MVFKKRYKMTEEHKRNIGLANKISLKGNIPWNKGKKGCTNRGSFKKGHKHSEETKIKINKTNFKKGQKPWNKGLKGYMAGEKNPAFNNWISREPYGKEFSPELKEQIRKRDNFRCQQCFRHQDELYQCKDRKIRHFKLSVHHIDFNKKNNNPNNLISLCRNCHNQTQFNRTDWTNYFQNRMG